jgi:hypothetical protein
MNLDDLLRDALHDGDATTAPCRDHWNDVRDRAVRVHKRRQRGRGAAALTAVTAVVAALVVFVAGGGDDRAPNVAAGPFEGTQVVALVRDQLVVMSPDDGHVVRVLVDGIDPTLTFGGITAAPDGEAVYFTRLRGGLPCDRQEIDKISAGGGTAEPVSSPASGPLVSPDADVSVSVVLRDLASGVEESFSIGVPAAAGSAQPLSWSPDGQRLLVGVYGDPSAPDPEVPVIAVLDRATGLLTPLGLTEPTETAAFLPDGRLVASIRVDGGHHVVTVNGDGAVGETLLESTTAGVLHSIRPNASGEVLLHFGGAVLQRWTPGQGEPVTIADDLVRDATWLPALSSIVQAPASAIVAVQDGSVVVLSPDDGAVIRTIAEGIGTNPPSPSGVAASPDGTTIYFTRVVDGCASIFRAPAAGGEATLVVGGGDPLPSPDGRWLAYVTSDCPGGVTNAVLGVTDLQSGTNYRPFERYFADHPAKLDVTAWAPGSDRLLFEVWRDFGDDDPSGQRALVLDDVPFGASNEPARLEYRKMIGVAAYQSNGHLLAARSVADGYEVIEIDGRDEVVVRYRDSGASPSALSVDATGRLLVSSPDRRLLVQEGAAAPREIADGVEGAGWLTSSEIPSSTTTTTAAPPVSVAGKTVTTRNDARPATVFAIRDRSVVELSSVDGAVVRAVTTDWPFIGSGDSLTVTDDRRFAFLTGALNEPIDRANPRLNVAMIRVDLVTGAIEQIGDGRWPMVTPDGSKLAYFPNDDARAVVRDLATGVERSATLDGLPTEQVTVAPVSWDPTGRNLVVRVTNRDSPLDAAVSEQLWFVDTETGGARPLDAPGDLQGPFDLRPLGSTGRWVAVVSGDDEVDELVEFDPETQTVGPTLLELDSFAKFMNAEIIDTDLSGRHLLFTLRQPPNPGSTGSVWRWSEGEGEPTKLGSGYQGGASW